MALQRVNASGIVKWYDPRKGYGYAARKDSPEVFLHYGALIGDGVIELRAGQKIEFLLEQTRHGAVAHDIRVVGA